MQEDEHEYWQAEERKEEEVSTLKELSFKEHFDTVASLWIQQFPGGLIHRAQVYSALSGFRDMLEARLNGK